MSVTQTVNVPESHRLFVEVPPEVPVGPVILTFTPATIVEDPEQEEIPNAETIAAMKEAEDMISGKKSCDWYQSPEDLIDALKKVTFVRTGSHSDLF